MPAKKKPPAKKKTVAMGHPGKKKGERKGKGKPKGIG